jgi:hypothetical protein
MLLLIPSEENLLRKYFWLVETLHSAKHQGSRLVVEAETLLLPILRTSVAMKGIERRAKRSIPNTLFCLTRRNLTPTKMQNGRIWWSHNFYLSSCLFITIWNILRPVFNIIYDSLSEIGIAFKETIWLCTNSYIWL